MISAWRGSRYLPAGVLLSLESSHMQLSGMRCAEAGGGFGDKASAAGTQDAEDFVEDGFAVLDDEEETGDDDGIDEIFSVAESVDVAVGKGTVL